MSSTGTANGFPCATGRRHWSQSLLEGLTIAIFSLLTQTVRSLTPCMQGGLPGALPGCGSAPMPWVAPGDLALTLSPPGRSLSRPSSSFSSETCKRKKKKKKHISIFLSTWGPHLSTFLSQEQGRCPEPLLLHHQHRAWGSRGRWGDGLAEHRKGFDAHTLRPQWSWTFPETWVWRYMGQRCPSAKSHAVPGAPVSVPPRKANNCPSVRGDRFLLVSTHFT